MNAIYDSRARAQGGLKAKHLLAWTQTYFESCYRDAPLKIQYHYTCTACVLATDFISTTSCDVKRKAELSRLHIWPHSPALSFLASKFA